MIDLDAIQRAAEGATDGPWRMIATSDLHGLVESEVGAAIATTHTIRGCGVQDAAHIAAADPSTVLALVAAVRAAREYARVCNARDVGEAVWPELEALEETLAPFDEDGQP